MSPTAATGSNSRLPRQRPAFVGRRRELDVLQQALQDVRAGQGKTVMVAGEPGIGKTRLVQEFTDRMACGGASILAARCENTEHAPALWPWLQVLEPLLSAGQCAPLPEPLPGAIANLDLKLNNPVSHDMAETGLHLAQNVDNRFMLFSAVLHLLRQLSASQPVIVWIDDLHWAHALSCELFAFIADHIEHVPILLIATCRNDGHSMNDRLSATLASVARQPGHIYMQPDRLESEDIANYLSATLASDVHQDTIDAVFTATGGNPFFMREVTWLIESSGESPGKGAPVRIPETLRHTIRERLSRLPQSTRDTLDVAAVTGHRFDLALLAGAGGQPVQQVVHALQPALLAGIVDEVSPDTFQFSHVLVRDAIYQNIPSMQRRMLHLANGKAIERLPAGIDPPYATLVHHFGQASTSGAARETVRYATLAAKESLARYAWDAALEQCQTGIRAIPFLDAPDPAAQCDLLLLLGQAQTMAGAGRESAELAGTSPDAVNTYLLAARLAEEHGLHTRLARAALGATGTALAVPQGGTDGVALLKRALDLLPHDQDTLRAEIMARLAVDSARLWAVGALSLGADDIKRIRCQSDEAIALARRTGNPRTLAWALTARRLAGEGTGNHDLWMDDADTVIELGRTTNDPTIMTWGLNSRYDILLEQGQSALADDVLEDLEAVTGQINTPLVHLMMANLNAGQAIRQGRLDLAEELINRAQTIWPDTAITAFQLVWLRREQCRLVEIQDRIRARHQRLPGSPLWKAFRLLCTIGTDESGRVQEHWEHLFISEFAALPRGVLWMRSLAAFAEVAHALGDRVRAATLYGELLPTAGQHLFVRNSDQTGGAVPMYLGLLSATRERWDDAELHFQHALVMNERASNKPYLAYTLYYHADTLNRRGKSEDRARTAAMARSAMQAASDMQMLRLSAMATELLERLPSAQREVPALGLTAREIEVLDLLVQGKTNREIAGTLFVSTRTVGSHVSNILAKLGVKTRTEAATVAIHHGIASGLDSTST